MGTVCPCLWLCLWAECCGGGVAARPALRRTQELPSTKIWYCPGRHPAANGTVPWDLASWLSGSGINICLVRAASARAWVDSTVRSIPNSAAAGDSTVNLNTVETNFRLTLSSNILVIIDAASSLLDDIRIRFFHRIKHIMKRTYSILCPPRCPFPCYCRPRISACSSGSLSRRHRCKYSSRTFFAFFLLILMFICSMY